MGKRHVIVRTTGGTWHRVSCLWVHVGVPRCRERVVSDAELARLDPVCDHCLGEP